MIVINDALPVFGVTIAKLKLTILKESKLEVQASSSYFNAEVGSWEPTIEPFNFIVKF